MVKWDAKHAFYSLVSVFCYGELACEIWCPASDFEVSHAIHFKVGILTQAFYQRFPYARQLLYVICERFGASLVHA